MSRTTALVLALAIVGCLAVALVALTVIGRQLVAAPAAEQGGVGTAPAGPAEVDAIAPPSAAAPASAAAATSAWEPHPGSPLPLTLLGYRHFSIGYDEQAKNPAWVLYQL